MLMKSVENYLSCRRATGLDLKNCEFYLRSYAQFSLEKKTAFVKTETAHQWAGMGKTRDARRERLNTIIRFARFMYAEDQRHEIPLKNIFGTKRTRRIPYIFSSEEISQLIEECHKLEPEGSLRPHTYATIFSLLVSTGIRISEALSLQMDDMIENYLVIRKTKFKKSRIVPLHKTTVKGMNRYLIHRQKVGGCVNNIFISVRGTPLSYDTFHDMFRKLICKIGIDKATGRDRPRIHDLRHRFAVQALKKSSDGRDHVGKHMLALSTYLGHCSISDTYWYLNSTPELMSDISKACETFMEGEVK